MGFKNAFIHHQGDSILMATLGEIKYSISYDIFANVTYNYEYRSMYEKHISWWVLVTPASL